MRKALQLSNKYTTEEVLEAAREQGYIDEFPDTQKKKDRLAELTLKNFGAEDLGLKANAEPLSPAESLYAEALNEEIENIPVSPVIEGDVPNLPLELMELSDSELMRLHGVFNALSARVGWLYAIEEAGENAAKLVVDQFENDYMAQADRKDFGGKAKSHAVLKAEAIKTFPEIKVWKTRQHKHSVKASKYKRLLERFDLNCDRLSRQYTYRTNEREHS